MSNYRECSYPHLRDYPDCYEECDCDECESGKKPFNDCPEDCENFPYCGSTDGCFQRLEKEYSDG